MKILFVGDVFGSPGRKALGKFLPQLSQEHSPDFIVVNGENAAGGFGLTVATAKELLGFGVDVITSGNHIWQKKEIVDFMNGDNSLIRPINYQYGPEFGYDTPGRGWIAVEKNGLRLVVINAIGRVFMDPVDDPFRSIDSALGEIDQDGGADAILVDFHAEASSEKRALGFFLDGRVSALLGTHTHVQTADEQILANGTAYITDVGMTGVIESVIGIEPESALFKFLMQRPNRFEIPRNKPAMINAVIVETDEKSMSSRSIERIIRKERF